MTSGLEIVATRPDADEARALIGRLDADLGARYPQEAIHGLHPEDVADASLHFVVARHEGAAVGCGALRPLAPGVGEIKRMFVVPEVRGRGIARRILSALEATARGRGYRVVRLETGIRQPEALGLYRSSGYRAIPAFGEYVGNPFSICLEKRMEASEMTPLPKWMRRTLFATAGMNINAAAAFIPSAGSLRALAGLPEGEQPLYLAMVGMFILLFGLGYLWTAIRGYGERIFITLAAVGKLSFFGMLVWLWAGGALPLRAPALGAADLVFGLLFVTWLISSPAGG